ncbi:hypothetical protein BH10BAC5_BH10BAC5_25340 [soil metagenome]
MKKELTNLELKEGLRVKLKQFEEQFEKDTRWIKDALKNLSQTPIVEHAVNKTGSERITLLAKCIVVLNIAQTPLHIKQLIAAVNQKYNKSFDIKSFSGQISSAYRKPNSAITLVEFPTRPLAERYFYVLKEWLKEDGNLKDIYLERINAQEIIIV